MNRWKNRRRCNNITGKSNKTREALAKMFLDSLSENRMPWSKTWDAQGIPFGQHHNEISRKPYTGVNAAILWITAMKMGYDDARWCTYKQAKDKEWQVKKGSKGVPIEFWKMRDIKQNKLIDFREAEEIIRKDPNRKEDMIPSARVYTVFNAAQMDGIPELPRLERKPIRFGNKQLKNLLKNYLYNAGVTFGYHPQNCFYRPSEDKIYLPKKEAFHSELDYYHTALHECAHSTGHEKRLNRDIHNTFGTPEYVEEELRAEISGAFVLSDCGLPLPVEITDNNKAYVQNWSQRIQDDPNVLARVIKAAHDISDYIGEKGELTILKQQSEKKPELVPAL